MSDVSRVASALLPQELFILWDDVKCVGWTQGSRIAFTGFAGAAEAAWGAAVAAAAIVRRRCGGGSPTVSAQSSNVVLVSADGTTWVESEGRRVARLIPPGGGPKGEDAGAASRYGFELDLGAFADELTVMSTGHVAYRALKKSRLPWALFAVHQEAHVTPALHQPTVVPAIAAAVVRITPRAA